MCDVLRGSLTSGGSAGGDRLFKWQAHYGIVSNPATTSLFVGLLDTTLTATSRAGTPGALTPSPAAASPRRSTRTREVAPKMCEDEVQLRLAAAVEKPSLFFGKMTAYIEDTSHSTRSPAAAQGKRQSRAPAAHGQGSRRHAHQAPGVELGAVDAAAPALRSGDRRALPPVVQLLGCSRASGRGQRSSPQRRAPPPCPLMPPRLTWPSCSWSKPLHWPRMKEQCGACGCWARTSTSGSCSRRA